MVTKPTDVDNTSTTTKKPTEDDQNASKGKDKGKDAKPEIEMSEEDAAFKENLELMVMRASDKQEGVAKLALETMRREIRTATRCDETEIARQQPNDERVLNASEGMTETKLIILETNFTFSCTRTVR